ncbi:MAG: tetratricopeptide repeat protein [Bacteroidetes bacterium]|nr:tetratricopeptide repeat protein [Bacteroidota bacterium]
MKRLIAAVSLVLLVTAFAYAQKEAPKPNVNKALTLAKQGKFDEAKAIVDAVPTHSKTQDDEKAWFYRGLVYIAMDTSSTYKGGADNVKVGAEALTKATEIAQKSGKKLAVMDEASQMSVPLEDLIARFNYAFLIKGDKLFGQEKFADAVVQFEKGLTLKPDTAIYRYAGYAAHNAGDVDKAIVFIGQYVENGGNNAQAIFLRVGSIYEYKKDFELALKAAREGLKIVPNENNLRQIELNCLIELKRYEEATQNLLASLKANPKDVESNYLLGALYEELKNSDEAKKYFKKCLEIDPKFLKAALSMARYGNIGFQSVKREMDGLDFKKDKDKLLALDKLYLERLREAAVLWESCEKISPNEREVLENLQLIYSPSQLDDKVKYATIEKKMKINGFLE